MLPEIRVRYTYNILHSMILKAYLRTVLQEALKTDLII